MSSNDKVYHSCLQWIIHPPFLDKQTMEAKFHRTSVTVAKWHVTLNFEKPRFGELHLKLSLTFDKGCNEPEEIVVSTLCTRISMGENSIFDRNVPIYRFNRENHYKYNLETSVSMYQMKPYQMVVEIRMFLAEDSEIRLLPSKKDRKRLVTDLSNLSLVPRYHNVDLHSSDKIVYRAHSYILGMRWRNLLLWPPFHSTAKTEIRTNISCYLLRHILMYMYSGLFIRNFPHWDQPDDLAELFKVIEKYDISHLRDSLVKSDSSQRRESKRPEISLVFVFRLTFVNDRPVNDASLTLHAQEFSTTLGGKYSENQFRFEIQVIKINGGAWLSYTLSSTVDGRIDAQVDLELWKLKVKMVKGKHRTEYIASKLAHEKSYIIRPRETVGCEHVLFLGCHETFGDFTSTDSSGRIEQRLRFKISLTDGTVVDEIRSCNSSVRSVHEKFHILVGHMSQLLERYHSDLYLQPLCRSGNNAPAFRPVHRAIIETRIPHLYNVLVSFQPGQNLSMVETIDLSEEALPYVIEYIYTAKFVNVPPRLLKEISDFAEKANLKCLSDLINGLSNNYSIQE